MVIIMNPEATAENIKAVIRTIEDAGLEAKVMDGASQRIVGVIGDKRKLGDVTFEAMDGVEKTVAISKSYKLASREFHPRSSVVDVAGVKIGDGTPVVMSGPCAVESREQLFEAADIVKKAGAQFLRGGAYKPRTSPYSFQGLEEQGLKFLAEARERTGLRVVTEVTTVEAVGRLEIAEVGHCGDLRDQPTDCAKMKMGSAVGIGTCFQIPDTSHTAHAVISVLSRHYPCSAY